MRKPEPGEKLVNRSTRSPPPPRPMTKIDKKARRNCTENSLEEIRELQRTGNVIPCAAMKRLVRQILHGFLPDAKITQDGFTLLREEAEQHVVTSILRKDIENEKKQKRKERNMTMWRAVTRILCWHTRAMQKMYAPGGKGYLVANASFEVAREFSSHA